MKVMIIFKRICAAIIDIGISFLPSYLVTNYISNIVIDISLFFFINYFIVACIIPIISKGKTIGDILVKIKLKSIDNNELNIKRILTRNTIYVVGSSMFLSVRDDYFFDVVFIISWLALYCVIFSNKNKYSENLTILDLIFKTNYTEEIK